MSQVREFDGIILRASNGLKTKLDVSGLRFKNTFLKAKKEYGIDLNDTNNMFKKNGTIWTISIIAMKYNSDGIYRESVHVYPYLNIK